MDKLLLPHFVWTKYGSYSLSTSTIIANDDCVAYEM